MEIKKNLGTVVNKLTVVEKNTREQTISEEDGDEVKMDAKSANPVENLFTFKAGLGLISNTIIDIQAFKDKVASDSTVCMMSQMKAIMGVINYHTIIDLPGVVILLYGSGSTIIYG